MSLSEVARQSAGVPEQHGLVRRELAARGPGRSARPSPSPCTPDRAGCPRGAPRSRSLRSTPASARRSPRRRTRRRPRRRGWRRRCRAWRRVWSPIAVTSRSLTTRASAVAGFVRADADDARRQAEERAAGDQARLRAAGRRGEDDDVGRRPPVGDLGDAARETERAGGRRRAKRHDERMAPGAREAIGDLLHRRRARVAGRRRSARSRRTVDRDARCRWASAAPCR